MDWYITTCRKLARYPVQKKRCEFLDYKFQRQSMPSVKMVANYSGIAVAGNDSDLSEENELYKLQVECKGVELALECLPEKKRSLLEMKYFREMKDIEVRTELEIASATYYKYKDEAVSTIAECLGIRRI